MRVKTPCYLFSIERKLKQIWQLCQLPCQLCVSFRFRSCHTQHKDQPEFCLSSLCTFHAQLLPKITRVARTESHLDSCETHSKFKPCSNSLPKAQHDELDVATPEQAITAQVDAIQPPLATPLTPCIASSSQAL